MRDERGVAIVAVLIVVAIVTGIAATILVDQQILIRRAENQLHGNLVILHLLAVETWAKEVLVEDLEKGASSDDFGEAWVTPIATTEVDGGLIEGKLEDLQGRFNINTLVDSSGNPVREAADQLKCLLEELNITRTSPANLVALVTDWMDSDQAVTPGGAEDAEYASLDPPYKTSSRPLASVTEMLLLRGIFYEDWHGIEPYISALPNSNTYINVNTASVEVLKCLHADMTSSVAQSIVDERQDEIYYSDWNSFAARIKESLGDRVAVNQAFWRAGFTSEYFMLSSNAQFGDLYLHMRHLIYRDKSPTGKVKTIARVLGDQL